jgi:amino acid adenylation domain-containing protein
MSIARDNIASVARLTPTQEGLLFHAIDAPGSSAYCKQIVCELEGPLHSDAMRAAWQAVLARYDTLRTFFTWERRDAPLQVVRERVVLPWRELDWRQTGASDARLQRWLAEDRAEGLSATQAPMTRISVVRDADEHWWMVWTFHHLVVDGWSTHIVLRDVFQAYCRIVTGQPPDLRHGVPFDEYVQWVRGQDDQATEAFWRRQLQGFDTPTLLAPPASVEPAADTDPRAVCLKVPLDGATANGLGRFAQACRVTPNTVVQGALALLLTRYTGQTDTLFGVTLSGRPPHLPDIEQRVGMFMNTLPLRVATPGAARVGEWLARLQAQNAELRDHEHSSLARVQALSDVPPRTPLFDTLLVFENFPRPGSLTPAESPVTLKGLDYQGISHYPLAVLAVPGDPFAFWFLFDAQRMTRPFVEQLSRHFTALLADLVRDPARRLADIAMLEPDEHDRVTRAWCGSSLAAPPPHLMHARIVAQAERDPDAVAVTCDTARLTYGELRAGAADLAARLTAAGLGPGSRVAVLAGRSVDWPVALLGVLECGAAYVPLDPTYPASHRAHVIADASVSVVVATGEVPDLPDGVRVMPARSAHTVTVDTRTVASSVAIAPDAAAYVIYTSGTAGRPKGVPVSHHNLVASTWARRLYYPGRVEGFLLLSSLAFDSSVAGIYWTLCDGGTLCLAPPGAEHDLDAIASLIRQHRVTHTLCLPTVYEALLDQARPGALDSLSTVIVAGERCPVTLAALHHRRVPGAKLYNEYGPTEGTVWSTVYEVPAAIDGPTVPIGRPIPGARTYVLDPHLQPVPPGVAGELYIGGAGVVAGYFNRPELTAERFIDSPFEPGDRLFRTGDLARWRGDGYLEFLGRRDHQIKIRGFRVEVEEIAAVLRQVPGIADAVVVARDVAPTRGGDA